MSLNREDLIKNLEEGSIEGVEAAEAASLLKILKRTDETKDAVKMVMEKTVDPEKLAWLGKLIDKGYERNLNTLNQFGLYDVENPKENDKEAPALDEVKGKILYSVTPEQVEAISGMQRPVLLLVPNTSGKRYLEALDGKKPIEGQINAYVSEWTRGALKRADKKDNVVEDDISGWKWAIVEGDTELPAPKDNRELLETRLETFKRENESKGVNGMDLKQYTLLQMQALLEGKPLDQQSCTILSGEPVKNSLVAACNWNARKVYLAECFVNFQDVDARFRPSVMGRI